VLFLDALLPSTSWRRAFALEESISAWPRPADGSRAARDAVLDVLGAAGNESPLAAAAAAAQAMLQWHRIDDELRMATTARLCAEGPAFQARLAGQLLPQRGAVQGLPGIGERLEAWSNPKAPELRGSLRQVALTAPDALAGAARGPSLDAVCGWHNDEAELNWFITSIQEGLLRQLDRVRPAPGERPELWDLRPLQAAHLPGSEPLPACLPAAIRRWWRDLNAEARGWLYAGVLGQADRLPEGLLSELHASLDSDASGTWPEGALVGIAAWEQRSDQARRVATSLELDPTEALRLQAARQGQLQIPAAGAEQALFPMPAALASRKAPADED